MCILVCVRLAFRSHTLLCVLIEIIAYCFEVVVNLAVIVFLSTEQGYIDILQHFPINLYDLIIGIAYKIG